MTPQIIGHRGARSLFAENTLEGFRAALALGIRAFEIDVGMTRDGVVVLSHDPALSPDRTRTANGQWLRNPVLLNRLTYGELAAFDVGCARPGGRVATRFPRQAGFAGARVPTLETVLQLDPAATWTIEIKTSPIRPKLTAPPEQIAEAVLAVAKQAGALQRCIFQSFDWRGPRHIRRIRPDLAYAWLTTRSTRAWRGGQRRLPQSVIAEGGGAWAPQYRELTRPLLAQAKAGGLRVVPWTVNSPDAIVRLARWGVDGIITDDPLVAMSALAAHPAEPGSLPHPARS